LLSPTPQPVYLSPKTIDLISQPIPLVFRFLFGGKSVGQEEGYEEFKKIHGSDQYITVSMFHTIV